jgi:hypothetical protein
MYQNNRAAYGLMFDVYLYLNDCRTVDVYWLTVCGSRKTNVLSKCSHGTNKPFGW